MTPDRWRQISRIYDAVSHYDAEQRGAFLRQVCADDIDLRHEVESLLAQEGSAESWLGHSQIDSAPLFVGRTIGSFQIESLLGAGGMGQVYRARDSKLGRYVALKILPGLTALDEDRLARFRREAQLLASLNHPNIGQIYGLEETEGSYALVLELVEGPTLADRIAQGAVPLAEALAIARQIAAALQAAHGRGIVHRDLKPANIKVRPDGMVKVLDFGLAKAFASDAGEAGALPAPSLTAGEHARAAPSPSTMTARGMILGTIAYMAPEQARGKEIDSRADIWAFGVVLFEMLTGRSPFAGESVADTVGAVLHREPDWSRMPHRLQPLLRRCLDKEPTSRLQSIADARLWLDDDASPRPQSNMWPMRGAAAIFLAATVALALWSIYFRASSLAVHPVRFQIHAPPETAFGGYFLVSPDGRRLAFQAVDSAGRNSIWVHSFDLGESRPLSRAGDVSSSSIFWSPDSRHIGFVGNDRRLKTIDIEGGPPQTICELSDPWGGATWNSDGVIVFGQRTGGLMRVSDRGGWPTPITSLDASREEVGHGGPRFLPDGRHFIYHRASRRAEDNGIYVGTVDATPDAPPSERLLTTSGRPVYASSDSGNGYILLVREQVLLAFPFDTRSLSLAGDPVPIVENVGAIQNFPDITITSASASATGVLAYRDVESSRAVPVWVDRNGREVGALVTEALDRPRSPQIAPDGQRIALTIANDLWVYHVDGRPPVKLTFEGNAGTPLWTPDGKRIVFENNGTARLFSVPADTSGLAVAASPFGHYHPYDWSPDGKLLVAEMFSSSEDANIMRFGADENATPEPVVRTRAAEGWAGLSLSPDWRWLAYTSNVTGRPEIWVQPYPGPGAPVRVSPDGGYEPVWSSDSGELYYRELWRLMSIRVKTGPRFEFEAPTVLFENRYVRSEVPSFDVASDGRFLMIKPSGPPEGTSPIHVVLNWMELLKSRAPRN